MTDRLWVFPALFCLLLAFTFFERPLIWGVVLCLLWLIRIILLKHKRILILTLMIAGLFVSALFIHKGQNKTHLQADTTTFLVQPKLTSIKVDGDRIQFEGMVFQPEDLQQLECVVIRYYAKSEAEKNMWLHEPPQGLLMVTGELKVPAQQTNFYQFDYRNYLERHRIYWQLNGESIQSVGDIPTPKSIAWRLDNARFRLLRKIDQTFMPRVASYIKTLFFADRRSMPEDMLENYRSIGIVHLLSISGFHISFLIHFFKSILLRMGVTHESTNMILLIMLPFYGLLAGFGVSVFRAVIQAMIQISGHLIDKDIESIDAWSFTMLLALFINPYRIYDIAFQLSYTLSGLFIVLGQQTWLKKVHPMLATLFFSFLANLASLPILSFHFYEISWLTPIANVVFIPLFTIFLFPCLITLLLIAPMMNGTYVFNFLNELMTQLIKVLEFLPATLNQYGNYSMIIGKLPLLIMVMLVVSIVNLIQTIEAKRWPSLVAISSLILCLSYYQLTPIGYVIMLDVGQGDAILIKDPSTQKVSLIDTGGQLQWYEKDHWQQQEDNFSLGKDIIVPSLKALGISKIDYLYLSHADMDHSGEILSMAEEIPIKKMIATDKTFKENHIYEQVKPLNKTQLQIVKPPMLMPTPFENTMIIHPQEEYEDHNNHSLVMYGKIGNDAWLFTGDIEAEVEHELIASYPNLRTDYLKVAHHGSRTSTTAAFIKHVQPQTALISAGKNNSYGHPHSDVLQVLEEEKVQVYQTNEVGAIRVSYLKFPMVDYWYKKIDTVYIK